MAACWASLASAFMKTMNSMPPCQRPVACSTPSRINSDEPNSVSDTHTATIVAANRVTFQRRLPRVSRKT